MRSVAALLPLLLLVPSSVGDWTGGDVARDLESLAVRDAVLLGEGIVLKAVDAEEGYAPSLSLQAEALRVATYRSYEEFNPPRGGVTIEQNNTNSEDRWTDATVTLLDARPGVVLFLESSSPVRMMDTRMSVSGHPQSISRETSTTPGEPPLRQASVTALHLVATTAADVTVAGDFVLSVWDWDIRVQSAEGSQDYWSGSRNASGRLSPVMDGKENQRIYLHVSNGTMALSLAGLDLIDLFVAGTTLDTASAVLDLAGEDVPVTLAGPLRFGLGPVVGGTFPGQVLTDEQGAAPVLPPGGHGGPQTAPATTANGDGGLWTTSLLLLVLAVAVALFVGWRALRLLRMRRALDDGDYRSVAASAGLENSRRFGPEVVVARVVCMVKTGEFAAAAGLLEKRGDRLSPAVRAYLWACVHAGSGAVDEAREAVIRSVMADPGMAVEVAANGSLRRFLADVGEGGYS